MKGIRFAVAALMLAAIILAPALGYTNQAVGNQSYSAISGPKINYSIESGVPAHSMTPEMIKNKYSFQAPGVGRTRMPYSLQPGDAMPYSFKVLGVDSAIWLGTEAKKETALLGIIANQDKTEPLSAVQFEPPIVLEGPVNQVQIPKPGTEQSTLDENQIDKSF